MKEKEWTKLGQLYYIKLFEDKRNSQASLQSNMAISLLITYIAFQNHLTILVLI